MEISASGASAEEGIRNTSAVFDVECWASFVGPTYALDLQDGLFLAQTRRGAARRTILADCDAALSRLRLYLRLAHRWRWLSDGQYEHVSLMVAEIGRLLGAWIRREAKGG
jgi:hypothetical protein